MLSFMSNVNQSGRKQRDRRRDRKARPGMEGLEQRQVLSTGTNPMPVPEIALASANAVTVPVRLDFGDLIIEKNGANIGKALLNWYVTYSYDGQTKWVAGSNPNDPDASVGKYGDWEHIPIDNPQTINVIAKPNNTITVNAFVHHVKGRDWEIVRPTMEFRYDPASRSFIHLDPASNTDVHTTYTRFHSENGNLRASLDTTLEVLNNDDFANAQGLSGPTPDTYGTTATAVGSNVNYTGQAGETNHATVSGSNISSGTLNSAWYKWTAPASGNVTINTFNSSFDTTLAVYTGNAVDDLTLADYRLAYNDDTDDNNGVYVPQSSVTGPAPTNVLIR